jgi:hypothetical protein
MTNELTFSSLKTRYGDEAAVFLMVDQNPDLAFVQTLTADDMTPSLLNAAKVCGDHVLAATLERLSVVWDENAYDRIMSATILEVPNKAQHLLKTLKLCWTLFQTSYNQIPALLTQWVRKSALHALPKEVIEDANTLLSRVTDIDALLDFCEVTKPTSDYERRHKKEFVHVAWYDHNLAATAFARAIALANDDFAKQPASRLFRFLWIAHLRHYPERSDIMPPNKNYGTIKEQFPGLDEDLAEQFCARIQSRHRELSALELMRYIKLYPLGMHEKDPKQLVFFWIRQLTLLSHIARSEEINNKEGLRVAEMLIASLLNHTPPMERVHYPGSDVPKRCLSPALRKAAVLCTDLRDANTFHMLVEQVADYHPSVAEKWRPVAKQLHKTSAVPDPQSGTDKYEIERYYIQLTNESGESNDPAEEKRVRDIILAIYEDPRTRAFIYAHLMEQKRGATPLANAYRRWLEEIAHDGEFITQHFGPRPKARSPFDLNAHLAMPFFRIGFEWQPTFEAAWNYVSLAKRNYFGFQIGLGTHDDQKEIYIIERLLTLTVNSGQAASLRKYARFINNPHKRALIERKVMDKLRELTIDASAPNTTPAPMPLPPS